MSTSLATFLFLLPLLAITNFISCEQNDLDVVQMVRAGVQTALDWARANSGPHVLDQGFDYGGHLSLSDCVKLYEDTKPLLTQLESGDGLSREDAVTWLSGALASHRSCLDGLGEKGLGFEAHVAQNLSLMLGEALALYGSKTSLGHKSNERQMRPKSNQNGGLLASWNPATSEADLVVAKDGSGNYKTINEAVAALARMGQRRPERVVIYVKSGAYGERVEIQRNMKNVMFVGDGMDKTIVTGTRNVVDGASTLSSATFGKSINITFVLLY
ncbi:hypothetical protein Acr_08g0010340 [Actinidia rufa]|uniref:Pectinesterase n=1 Tax=Actinidia rufa TaxID=165716 RepID=A0A7J0F1R4_9ERIC|nr:hypothetical protein Acr_08g0010340 [Actinidia rufa]